MMTKNFKYLFLLLISLSMLLTLSACGKKGMPKPPRYVEPPAVTDLVVQNVENDVLTLSWSMPQNAEEYNLKLFRVYMAQDALATLCLTCPPNFVYVSEAKGTANADGSRSYIFQIRVTEGFRYVYKVNAVGRENHEGKDSNYAVYSYEETSFELTE